MCVCVMSVCVMSVCVKGERESTEATVHTHNPHIVASINTNHLTHIHM